MADDIDTTVIKKTQEIVGSIIKKPVLTEKSLKKPPFRFLHDIITNVIKSTGFLKGLYTSEELQSENVKDKESKIAFLQKAIDVLSIVTEQPVNLKPLKVVAGHDPQKTNLFLQLLATAAKSKLDSKAAVEKVLNEKAQGSPVKAPKDRKASIDKRSKEKEKAHARSLTKTIDPAKKSSSQSKDPSKSKDGEKSKEKSRESKRDREKSRDRGKHKTDEAKKVSKEKEKSSAPKENLEKEEENVEQLNEQEIVNHLQTAENEDLANLTKQNDAEPFASLMNGEAHEEQNEIQTQEVLAEKPVRERSHRPHSSRSARPPSARSKRTKPTEENAPVVGTVREPLMATSAAIMGNGPLVPEQTFENVLIPSTRPPSARPPSARPSSSRPAPPRIRIRHVVDNEETNIRPTTAKPVENVILDQSHQSDEEEEETFILLENEPPENLEVETVRTLPAQTPDEDKGSLVKKLLETKKDLEGGSQHTPTKKVEIDKSQMSEAARNRERDSASKELGQLRNFVQSLSKTAIPLGRMLDFLQEDIDGMKMELKMWKEEHAQNLVALHKEQSTTESLLVPLRAQLDDLDQVVQNQLDANSALKSSITRNDERIQRMLSSVNNNHKS